MKSKGRYRILRLAVMLICVTLAAVGMVGMQTEAAAKKGWVTKGSARYYYQDGQPVKGFRKIKSDKYYFNPSNGKMLRNKWKEINKKYYYFGSKGKMVKKRWIGNYYLGSNGIMAENKWIGKYFVGEDGKWIPNFKGGWHKIGGKWYYYKKDGTKKTGWITSKGQRYYLNENGVMLTRQNKIKTNTYYFKKTGEMTKSSWVKSGSWYYYANSKGILNTKERMNAKNYADATVMEYKSSSLKIRVEKHRNYGAVYWTAHVKVQNARQLKSALSYGTYGGTRQLTSSAVKANDGVIGVNGSAFDAYGRPGFDAVMIKNGQIYNKAHGTSYSVMAVDWDGTMYTPAQGLSASTLVRNGVKDTYNFGPVLLQNGKTVPLNSQGDPRNFSLVTYKDPRTAVGMVRPGEYVLLVADGRTSNGSMGLRYNEMLSIFKGFGCSYAYNLDGGGSSAMYYCGRLLNKPSDGAERPCGDFLLFTN